MVRKRAASEMELQTGDGVEYHNRFLRRTTSNPLLDIDMGMGLLSTNTIITSSDLGGGSGRDITNSPNPPPHSIHVPNYSTTTLLSSTTTNTTVTSNASATNNIMDGSLLSPQHHHHLPQQQQGPHTETTRVPSVCVFSGLPLFPPTIQRNLGYSAAAGCPGGQPVLPSSTATSDAAALPPLPFTTSTTTTSAGIAMEDSSSAAMAWIDGIIKDLIHSSSHVSINQLIHNVREIIHPCNPSLAAVLECRLRSLTDPNYPNTTTTSTERRGSSSIIRNSSSELVQRHLHHYQTIQQKGGLVQFQGQGSSSSSASAADLKLYRDFSDLDNTLPSSAAASHPINHYLNWGLAQPTTKNMVTPTDLTPSNQNQMHEQSSQQLHPQEQQQDSSPVGAGAAAEALIVPPTVDVIVTREKRKEEIRQQKRDEEGLHLLTLLLQCAEAVSADNFEEANRMLLEISELSTPFGTSAQRVGAYFSEAMSARLVNSCLGIYAALPPTVVPPHGQKMASAFQVFNGISPFVKFSHFTANQAIQEAFEREDRVHIIDLDIMQGLQWPGLFHILASRPGGPPSVRLTGFGTSMDALEATGKRLSDFADKLGLPFEFSPVADKVGNLDPERFSVSKREAVAVHWLQHSLYDVTGSDANTLWLLQR